MSKHLDLGCGNKPRNPYAQNELFGIDLMTNAVMDGASIVQANLSTEAIPFADNHFDSVSAYDFLEHIPRVMGFFDPSSGKTTTRNPFIELMNEVWRVLKNEGLFYAITPVYPDQSVFVDPTHVNFITLKTHRYFCLPDVGAEMYGFKGSFKPLRVKRLRHKYLYEPQQLDVKQWLRKGVDKLYQRESHVLWEFQALKP
jgi:SAM-dependent methyltransferase